MARVRACVASDVRVWCAINLGTLMDRRHDGWAMMMIPVHTVVPTVMVR